MRLDVIERHVLSFEEAFQRADLVDKAVGEFVSPDLHLATAEALTVWQGWMRADLDPVSLGQLDSRAHVVEIGGVETAGDIGDVDRRHDAAVVAQAPDPIAFAHVAIQERHRPLQLPQKVSVANGRSIVKSEKMIGRGSQAWRGSSKARSAQTDGVVKCQRDRKPKPSSISTSRTCV